MYRVFLALLFVGCSAPLRTTVVLTQADLQAKVDKKFPVEKDVVVAKLVLEAPAIHLTEGSDRVALELDAGIRVGFVKYTGRLGVLGDLEYDEDSSALFLRNAEVTKLDVPDLPAKYHDEVRAAATGLVRAQLEVTPVHRLKKPHEKMFVKSVTIRDQKAIVEVGL